MHHVGVSVYTLTESHRGATDPMSLERAVALVERMRAYLESTSGPNHRAAGEPPLDWQTQTSWEPEQQRLIVVSELTYLHRLPWYDDEDIEAFLEMNEAPEPGSESAAI
jgi:hypothetical protein